MSLRTGFGGRRYYVTIPRYYVDCDQCRWHAETRNAKGLAAQHHDRTGHTVRVEETRTTVYTTEEAYNEGLERLERGREAARKAADG